MLHVVNILVKQGGCPNVTHFSLIPSAACVPSTYCSHAYFSTVFPRLRQLRLQFGGLNAEQSCVFRSFKSDICANQLPDIRSVSIDGDTNMSWCLFDKLLSHCPHLLSAGALSPVCPLTHEYTRLLRTASDRDITLELFGRAEHITSLCNALPSNLKLPVVDLSVKFNIEDTAGACVDALIGRARANQMNLIALRIRAASGAHIVRLISHFNYIERFAVTFKERYFLPISFMHKLLHVIMYHMHSLRQVYLFSTRI